MFSHVTIGVSDTARAKAFYEPVLAPLGIELRTFGPQFVSWHQHGEALPFFTALTPFDDALPSAGNGAMVAFLAPDRTAVDAAYATAMEAGGLCEGPPGLRPQYHASYYGAYMRDPDGNKIHVVCHEVGDDA